MFSVVVPSKTVSNLAACVAAVRRNEPELPAECVIVVDDSEEGDFRILRYCEQTGVTCIKGAKPFVYSRNSNIGLRCAFYEQGADGAVLLNDDALLESAGGFSILARSVIKHPEFGLVGVTTNVTGQPLQQRQTFGLRQVPHFAFVGTYIPKTTIERVGFLDEQFCLDYGCEDRDMCEAVNRARLLCGVHDSCYVDHGSLSSSFRGLPTAARSYAQNYALLKAKWGSIA